MLPFSIHCDLIQIEKIRLLGLMKKYQDWKKYRVTTKHILIDKKYSRAQALCKNYEWVLNSFMTEAVII